MKNTSLSYLSYKMPSSISGLVWWLVRLKVNLMACDTFQMLKTSISLVHDLEDHMHCLSPGVLGNNQLEYVWNYAKEVRLSLKA